MLAKSIIYKKGIPTPLTTGHLIFNVDNINQCSKHISNIFNYSDPIKTETEQRFVTRAYVKTPATAKLAMAGQHE